MLLKLGEASLIRLAASSQVLQELENAVRRKAPEQLGALALLLDRAGLETTDKPETAVLDICQELVAYRPDARVLAAAWTAEADYFVTLDKRHFLENKLLRERVPFPLGTPGDCLGWYRKHLSSTQS